MKSMKLIRAFGKIDDRYMIEAMPREEKAMKKNQIRVRRLVPLAAAACLVIAALTVLGIAQPWRAPAPPEKELPMLVLSAYSDPGGYGVSPTGGSANNTANGNLLNAGKAYSKLPVYRNPMQYDERYSTPVSGLSGGEMLKIATDTAAAMGWRVDSAYTRPNEEELRRESEKIHFGEPDYVWEPPESIMAREARAVCGTNLITVGLDGKIAVSVNGGVYDDDGGVDLPEALRFDYETADQQELENVMEYLLREYAGIVNMKEPVIKISIDDSGYRFIELSAYEGAGNQPELNPFFNWVSFTFDSESSRLLMIYRTTDALTSQKLGDYPIISVQQAKELLYQYKYLGGKSQQEIGLELPGEEAIIDIVLAYRVAYFDSIFIPFYIFTFKVPEDEANDWMGFAAEYYVPAVEGRYIADVHFVPPGQGRI